MELIILTAHYPYKPGEEFLDDEINILSKVASKITIVSGEKDISRFRSDTPENVEVVIVNRRYEFMGSFLRGIKRMFTIETLNEIIYAKRELGYKINLGSLRTLFIYNVSSEAKTCWIKRNLRKDEEKIILYSYWLSVGAYSLSRLKKEGYKFKAISRAHGSDAFLDRGYLPYRREIYKFLDEIHFVSDAGRIQFKDKIKFEKGDMKSALFTSRLGTEKHSQVLNPFNGNEYIHIVTCSSIIYLKRLDLLINALTRLYNYSIKWTHFGDGPLKESIQQLVKERLDSMSKSVEFKGRVTNSEIKEFYASNHIDIFVNMSDDEGVPVSIMEAISFGIPVIARDVGGNSEIVHNGVNGILLPKEIEPLDLAKAIENFIALPEQEIAKYREEAFESWYEKYRASKNYHEFGTHIKSLI